MSARDSASGSSTYKGGSGGAGGLGNGGIGGGAGGGYRGGGSGYNGGAGSRTGLTTGAKMYGNTAYGAPGGVVQAYGMRDARSLGRAGMGPTVGSYGNFQTPAGHPMFAGSPVQGQVFHGMNMGQALSQAQRAQAAYQAANRPQVGGILDAPADAPTIKPAGAIPNFINNPFVNKPATLPGYVMDTVQSYLKNAAPDPAAPGLRYTYNNALPAGTYPGMYMKPSTMMPAYTTGWAKGGWQNNSYGPSRVTQRNNSTDAGGYPSLNSPDTRPAGVY